MTKPRVIETEQGIQGEFTTQMYDRMMRRDMNLFLRWFMYVMAKPKKIRPGLISSINAAYIVEEIKTLLNETKLKGANVTRTFIGLEITGEKT